MPNWQPVSVPDFCPTCGVYWECECEDTDEMSEFEEAVEAASAAGKRRLREMIDRRFDESGIPDTFTFNKLDSLGLAKAGDA